MADDDFIVAPAWLTPPPAETAPPPPVVDAAADPITLPPGIADSATHKLPPERQRTPPPKPEVSFFPGPIGAPAPSPAAPPPPPPGYAAPAAPAVPVAPAAPAAPAYPPPAYTAPPPAAPAQPAAPPPPPAQSPPTFAAPLPPVTRAPSLPPAAAAPPAAAGAPLVASTQWTITLESGESVSVDGALYLGRNPTAGTDYPTASTLVINDPRKSVSKTHAVLLVNGQSASLTDLHSTNGCAVIGADGSELVLTPRVPLPVVSGATIKLGDYVLRLSRS